MKLFAFLACFFASLSAIAEETKWLWYAIQPGGAPATSPQVANVVQHDGGLSIALTSYSGGKDELLSCQAKNSHISCKSGNGGTVEGFIRKGLNLSFIATESGDPSTSDAIVIFHENTTVLVVAQ